MTNMTADQSQPLATLHIISHIRWQREGHEPFVVSRAQLLDTLTRLLAICSPTTRPTRTPIKHFLLGGQTVILEDVAAVRPDLLALLRGARSRRTASALDRGMCRSMRPLSAVKPWCGSADEPGRCPPARSQADAVGLLPKPAVNLLSCRKFCADLASTPPFCAPKRRRFRCPFAGKRPMAPASC